MGDNPTCPICAKPLTIPVTGRHPTYCSRLCRQAAHRARRRATKAVRRAAELRAELSTECDRLLLGVARLSEQMTRMRLTIGTPEAAGPPGPETGGRPAPDTRRGPGRERGDTSGRSGWEAELAAAARMVTEAAQRAARLADDHHRVVWEHGEAVRMLEPEPCDPAAPGCRPACRAVNPQGPRDDHSVGEFTTAPPIQDAIQPFNHH